MKNILTFSLLLIHLAAQAQKHDNVWMAGRGKVAAYQFSNGITYLFGAAIIDFQQSPPKPKLENLALNMYPTAIISDKKGNLIAYTNGCHIVNKNHEIMDNGDTINPGYYQGQNQCLFYYPTYQGAIFLPDPANENRYYLFHMALDYSD
ncbi:MAG TPA: hypothetical protein DCF33_16940, partial [Saprospirales bacterium]|nr:hypothetical protein [Saprospirales bacterium]